MMKKVLCAAGISLTLGLIFSACIRRPTPIESAVSRELATPIADSPAAGICAEHEGSLVSVTIYPDIPDPRCSFVKPDQYLRVVNMRGERITVELANLKVEIAPGGEYTFDQPLGTLLMPGVHRFGVSPCCGAELVLQADP